MKTIVIIPAYNEELKAARVIKEVIGVSPDFDILVINDGSSDNTAETARDAGAFVLSHPFNMGYGISLQTGYKYAFENGYEVIAQIDADGQHDPKYIPEMIKMLAAENADVVVGSRFKTETRYRAPLMRRIGIIFFGLMVTLVTRKKVTDPTSGYQVMSRNVLPFLVSEAFPYDYPDADFLIMLHYIGFKTVEFSMVMHEACDLQSMHRGIFKNLYYVFKMCLSIFLILISEKIKKGRKGRCR